MTGLNGVRNSVRRFPAQKLPKTPDNWPGIGGKMLRVWIRQHLSIASGLAILSSLMAGCSSARPTSPPPGPSDLWGDMKPVVSVKELMRDMLDPIADNIFDSVRIVVDKHGTVETAPRTEEDWARIRIGGTTLAEGAYLLKVPRPFAPPGDENNSIGPEAVELSPAQILAKITRDPVEWNARIEALRNVGLQVLDIVKRKDVNELWEAGENLDIACEACHRSYWYPGETPAFYDRLDRRLRQYDAKATRSGPAATSRVRSR
jgi:hypothetical protein